MSAADTALPDAAFHNERVAARRLARAQGMTEHEALRMVLTQAAVRAGFNQVETLLAARAQARSDDLERRAAKVSARAAARAQKLAQRHGRDGPRGWRAWFDGSATPNPGAIGVGALLWGPDGERVEISRRAGHGGSSDAEYLALIALLEAAVAAGATPLAIHGDSQVVINDAGCAGAAAKGMDVYRLRVQALMAQLGKVTLHWVPRHRNGDADRLSQQAIHSHEMREPG